MGQRLAVQGIRSPQVLTAIGTVERHRLVASGHPLATPMTLRWQGTALDWQAPPQDTADMQVTGKVLLLIHGLCMNDLQWQVAPGTEQVDLGAALAASLGYTPVHLRYNTGQHISDNGLELARQLGQRAQHWRVPLQEITVLAHSMGGLVTRSAVHQAHQQGQLWPTHLKNIVFLGTPHHGAPLERAGNWVDVLLGSSRFSAPFARLAQLRSAGITDLRYGHVLAADWQGRDRFRREPDSRALLPLPEAVACYTVAATTASNAVCWPTGWWATAWFRCAVHWASTTMPRVRWPLPKPHSGSPTAPTTWLCCTARRWGSRLKAGWPLRPEAGVYSFFRSCLRRWYGALEACSMPKIAGCTTAYGATSRTSRIPTSV